MLNPVMVFGMGKKKAKSVRKAGRRPRERAAEQVEFLRQLGAKIKTARIAAGMTGEDLARAIGIATATQYHREAGRQSGQWEDLQRYSAALGCKTAALVP